MTNDEVPGFGRSQQHPTTGTVHREVDQVKPAEYENGTTIEGSNGLDAAHARENGVDEDPSSEHSGQHFVHNGSMAGEDATGIGHGPAAAALGRTGYDSLTHGHEHPSKDVDPDPSHTYAHGILPPPNDGKVNIGGNPENPREAMAYEPRSQTGSSAHDTQRKGSDDAKLDPVDSRPSGQRKVSDDAKLDSNNSSPSDQKKGSSRSDDTKLDANNSSPGGHVHPGGSTKGGVSDKFVGKVQHAAGVLFHNENMKAKGTEKETCVLFFAMAW
jgi:hypothetical protein